MTKQYMVTGAKVRFGPGFVLELNKTQAMPALTFFTTRKGKSLCRARYGGVQAGRDHRNLLKAIYLNHGGIRWRKLMQKKPKQKSRIQILILLPLVNTASSIAILASTM